MLEAWSTIIREFQDVANDFILAAATRIFNVYLQCHLASPNGSRKRNESKVEEIEDNEDNDRIRFRDQLQTIGMFGRIILVHTLPVLCR